MRRFLLAQLVRVRINLVRLETCKTLNKWRYGKRQLAVRLCYKSRLSQMARNLTCPYHLPGRNSKAAQRVRTS